MSANTALITESAKTAARQTLSDYSTGVFAHTTGDWATHNVVKIHDQVFQDLAGHTDTVKTLRILGTLDDSDLAIAIPINPTGSDVLLTSAPIITVQPASQSISLSMTARLTVGAISDTALTYQWYKAGVAMTGQTLSQLVIPSFSATDVAAYLVKVTNTYGTTTSAVATLSVATGNPVSGADGGFDIFGALFSPFHGLF